MDQKLHRVKEVIPGSIAEEAGIEPGDYLVAINGASIADVIEYRFMINDEYIEVMIQKPSGEQWLLEIDKDPFEDLGMVFQEDMMDEARRCKNNCVFCFIDQLPKGMRKSLYFKDDDSRMSFLQGNFITLTNLKNEDVDRIIRYRISPLNVSVHTTEPELRVKMLKNPKAGEMLGLLEKFADNGIILNCQLVLCPGINDGEHLDRTISDLGRLWPGVKSIGVVPVGLTRFRQGLYPIKPCDAGVSRKAISQIEKWQDKFMKEKGSRVVYAADEFYLKAGFDIPGVEEYEDFPQLENGIGLIALFKSEIEKELLKTKANNNPGKDISIATGKAAYGFMKEVSRAVEEKHRGIKIKVFPIINNFFGETIDVSGLVTGRDLIEQLKDENLGDMLFIPENMLKSGEEIFLDDTTVGDVRKELGVKVVVCPVKGDVFIRKIFQEDVV
jgi:putative radical SAM enzyme (TIGR03279 family)